MQCAVSCGTDRRIGRVGGRVCRIIPPRPWVFSATPLRVVVRSDQLVAGVRSADGCQLSRAARLKTTIGPAAPRGRRWQSVEGRSKANAGVPAIARAHSPAHPSLHQAFLRPQTILIDMVDTSTSEAGDHRGRAPPDQVPGFRCWVSGVGSQTLGLCPDRNRGAD